MTEVNADWHQQLETGVRPNGYQRGAWMPAGSLTDNKGRPAALSTHIDVHIKTLKQMGIVRCKYPGSAANAGAPSTSPDDPTPSLPFSFTPVAPKSCGDAAQPSRVRLSFEQLPWHPCVGAHGTLTSSRSAL